MFNFLKRPVISDYPPFPFYIDLRNRLPRRGLEKLTVLNVGMGEGNSGLAQQLYLQKFKRLDIIDVHQPYLDAAKARTWATDDVHFIFADLRNYLFSGYDLILIFDVLEHLKKEESLKILEKIKCKLVIFIPLEEHFRPNVYEVESQNHLSTWTEQDFKELGFRTEVLKDFHHEGGLVFPALWALKN
ncbi:MAG: class I SAM-dependent methyltransferase [Candidatus Moranbacteria bacterium]|nr:class I SAM-dependent methyltransferase [Candidatus Moranbacteria bacterium]